jgi:hypothetical protein
LRITSVLSPGYFYRYIVGATKQIAFLAHLNFASCLLFPSPVQISIPFKSKMQVNLKFFLFGELVGLFSLNVQFGLN